MGNRAEGKQAEKERGGRWQKSTRRKTKKIKEKARRKARENRGRQGKMREKARERRSGVEKRAAGRKMKAKAKAPEKEMGKGEARIQANGARQQGKWKERESMGKRGTKAQGEG